MLIWLPETWRECRLTGAVQTYTFARDLRTCQMLKEALEENRNELHKVNKRVRGILAKLVELGGDTVKGVRGRMRDIKVYMEGV